MGSLSVRLSDRRGVQDPGRGAASDVLRGSLDSFSELLVCREEMIAIKTEDTLW